MDSGMEGGVRVTARAQKRSAYIPGHPDPVLFWCSSADSFCFNLAFAAFSGAITLR